MVGVDCVENPFGSEKDATEVLDLPEREESFLSFFFLFKFSLSLCKLDERAFMLQTLISLEVIQNKVT